MLRSMKRMNRLSKDKGLVVNGWCLLAHSFNVFKKMLNSGHPPDDWNALLKEAKNLK
jgi:hypothetical protein